MPIAETVVSEQFRTRYEVPSTSSFEGFRRAIRLIRTLQACVGGAFAMGVLFYAIVSGPNPVVVAGVPILIPIVGMVGLAMWLLSATTQLWHMKVRKWARADALDVFAVGRTPIGSGYLVLGRDAVSVLNRDLQVLARLPLSEIRGAALLPSDLGVGMVIRWQDAFFEFPIVLKVSGPTAYAWSTGGFGERKRLLGSLREDLRAINYLSRHLRGRPAQPAPFARCWHEGPHEDSQAAFFAHRTHPSTRHRRLVRSL